MIRLVGRRVEAGQPRRRFMGGSGCWERDMMVWYGWCYAEADQFWGSNGYMVGGEGGRMVVGLCLIVIWPRWRINKLFDDATFILLTTFGYTLYICI